MVFSCVTTEGCGSEGAAGSAPFKLKLSSDVYQAGTLIAFSFWFSNDA